MTAARAGSQQEPNDYSPQPFPDRNSLLLDRSLVWGGQSNGRDCFEQPWPGHRAGQHSHSALTSMGYSIAADCRSARLAVAAKPLVSTAACPPEACGFHFPRAQSE